jgi:hypothetical protein
MVPRAVQFQAVPSLLLSKCTNVCQAHPRAAVYGHYIEAFCPQSVDDWMAKIETHAARPTSTNH